MPCADVLLRHATAPGGVRGSFSADQRGAPSTNAGSRGCAALPIRINTAIQVRTCVSPEHLQATGQLHTAPSQHTVCPLPHSSIPSPHPHPHACRTLLLPRTPPSSALSLSPPIPTPPSPPSTPQARALSLSAHPDTLLAPIYPSGAFSAPTGGGASSDSGSVASIARALGSEPLASADELIIDLRGNPGERGQMQGETQGVRLVLFRSLRAHCLDGPLPIKLRPRHHHTTSSCYCNQPLHPSSPLKSDLEARLPMTFPLRTTPRL